MNVVCMKKIDETTLKGMLSDEVYIGCLEAEKYQVPRV